MLREKELIHNTAIISLGKLSTQFLTFLLLPLYTSYLSTDEFGTVDLILTFVVLLAPLITIQMEMAAFRFLIDARKDEGQKRIVISNVTQIALTGFAVFVLLYALLNVFISVPYAWFVFGAVAGAIATGLLLQIARGFGDNLKFAIGGVVAGITTIAANIAFIVVMGLGVEGMLMSVVAGNIAASTYLFFGLKIYSYLGVGLGNRALKRKLLGYSAPLVPNGVSWWLINAADRTIITIVLGVASNGIYAVAYRFPLIFNGLFSFFGMSWTESASVHINSPDRDKYFSQVMNASVRLFGSLGVGIIAFVPLIFGLLVNESFHEAYWYIPILIVGAFFNSIVGLYSAIYIAKKMTRQVMTTSLIAAGTSIGFTLIFIKHIGIYAPAFAMVVAFMTMAIYRHYDMKKYVNITYDSRIFVTLALLYGLTISLYYLADPMLNILNAVAAIVLLALYNKSMISTMKNKLNTRRKSALSPDQLVAEDAEERTSL